MLTRPLLITVCVMTAIALTTMGSHVAAKPPCRDVHVTVQVMKRGITPPLAPPERLREAETGPLHPAGRRHTLR